LLALYTQYTFQTERNTDQSSLKENIVL